jgi:predicted phosphodiesterase
MRLLILSDLHREIYPGRDLGIDLSVSNPDVVILAGDIDKAARSIPWASETFKGIEVLYVAGNHEYYGSNIDTVPAEIYDACLEVPNVRFMNRDEFVIGDVRFLGATMWTDFALFGEDNKRFAMHDAERGLNDYRAIRVAKSGYRKLSPIDTAKLHDQHRTWLNAKLFDDFTGKNVVITHMAPSMGSVPDAFRHDALTPCYASDLTADALLANLWIHGHTHTSMDYKIGKCRVVCNPCGYAMEDGTNENPSFNPNLIIEI